MECQALNQLWKLISVTAQLTGTAELPTELFLQRLNAQGLEIFSPWVDKVDGKQLRGGMVGCAQSLDRQRALGRL